MSAKNQGFDEIKYITRDRMDKHKVALSVLAQSENSAYWTDESPVQLEAAKV